MRARSAQMPVAAYRERMPAYLSAVERLPRTFIFCTGDGGEPPVAPGTPGWDVVTIRTGHWPMVTRPAELADLLAGTARG